MMMKKIKMIILILILFIPSYFVFADKNEKVYQIAYIDNFYPFQDTGKNGPDGFVIDLLNSVSKEENMKLIYQPMSLSEAIQSLSEGKIDGIAGLKYTAELDNKFDFSEAFTTVSYSIVVLENNETIKSLTNLGSKVVAIERGDESQTILRDIRGVQIIETRNEKEAFKLLELGRADAFLGNTFFAKAYIQKYQLKNKYKLLNDIISPSDYAFATNEGNGKLIKQINHGLIKIRAKQVYQEIYNKWFGWENSELARRLQLIIIYLLVSLFLVLVYVFFTMRWNKKLKLEVYKRTAEIEAANTLLKQKIEEEKVLRSKLVYKEKMQTLGQLVAGIAHELRNPLTSIKTFIELIPFKFDNAKFRKEISTYLPSEINRLNKLVTNLLDYAKPQEPKKIVFNLNECFESIFPLFQVQLSKKEIKIIKGMNTVHYVYADFSQIKQVIINILINAMDAIKSKGEIRIKSEDEGELIKVTIEDNGIGIAQDKIPLIFEPFFTDKLNGTGLGLSLSLQYINENDGEMLIESSLGIGTKVTILLPRRKQI